MFGYENELVFPIYVSDKEFKNSIDLSVLINDDHFHYVYIKHFNTFIFHIKKIIKIKNVSVKVVYSVLVMKMR